MPVTCARTCTVCSGTIWPTACSTTGMGWTRATVVSTVNGFGSVGLCAARVQPVSCSSSVMAKEPTIATQRGRRHHRLLSQAFRASLEAPLRSTVSIQKSSIRDPLRCRSWLRPNRFHLNSEQNVHVETVGATNGDAELSTIEAALRIRTTDLTLEVWMIGNALKLHNV